MIFQFYGGHLTDEYLLVNDHSEIYFAFKEASAGMDWEGAATLVYINPPPPAPEQGWGEGGRQETGTKRVSLKPNPSCLSPTKAAGGGGKGALVPSIPERQPHHLSGGDLTLHPPQGEGIRHHSLLRPRPVRDHVRPRAGPGGKAAGNPRRESLPPAQACLLPPARPRQPGLWGPQNSGPLFSLSRDTRSFILLCSWPQQSLWIQRILALALALAPGV